MIGSFASISLFEIRRRGTLIGPLSFSFWADDQGIGYNGTFQYLCHMHDLFDYLAHSPAIGPNVRFYYTTS
jgi:hypothetical protein